MATSAPLHGASAMPTDLYAVILAGGRGTRFWPLSRRARPKQCLSLAGEQSMLQETVRRLHPLIPVERIIVITGPSMAHLVREQLPDLPVDNIVVEPSPRNTAPCIALGAVEVARRGGGRAVMAVLPADHHIGAPADLRHILLGAREAARSTNALITLGIRPRYPESGYGYLQVGVEMGEWGGRTFHMVERFTEKPSVDVATGWVEAGTHLWNAGMFVFTVDAIRDAIREHLPSTAMAMLDLSRDRSLLESVWESMDATSIDYGIMERSRHILTVPCDPGWSDLGAWPALDDVLPDVEGGKGKAQPVLAVDADRCTVFAPGKAVALIGVSDLVVVDTEDALLVMSKDRAQDLRGVLSRLDDEAPHLT